MHLIVNSTNTYVVIPAERQIEAFQALLTATRNGGGTFVDQQHPALSELILDCWGWHASLEPRTGAIHAISYDGEAPEPNDRDRFFRAIAPFVASGGYIVVFTGDQITEFHFDGAGVISLQYARTTTTESLDFARTQALQQLKKRIREGIRTHYSIVPQFRADHYEARAWLVDNGSPFGFASNAFHHKDAALRYVNQLYVLGARHVCVTHVFDRLCDTLFSGGPYADALAVELPEQKDEAQALRDFCQQCSPGEHSGIITHAALFWEDMIPEGWIGMCWD